MTELRPETRAAQALGAIDPATGGVVPPLQPSTTFVRGEDYELLGPHGYARDQSPAFGPPEALLASLEGAAACRLFASGMAAITAVFQSLAPGDHVVVSESLYWGVRSWLNGFARPWGLDVEFVPNEDLDALRAAMRPEKTKLVWIETPGNPTWQITPIAEAAEIAHGVGARLAVDSTVATPVLTRPIEHGADIVVHAATKSLNGHSDVLAGAVLVAREDEFSERLDALRHEAGAILGAFEAWLLLRGMRTLYPRVRAACANAQAIAEFLAKAPGVVEVLYPGLPSHPGHAAAARQMTGGFGAMLSFRIEGGAEAALAVAGRLRLIHRATSLGGVETLVEHRASVEGGDSPVPEDLLRLSCGIEATEDLLADLEQALSVLGS